MKKYLAILLTIMYTGCSTVDKEDRGYCLDYKSAPVEEEKCTPLYGAMICTVEQRTRYWCALWSEEAKPKKDDE